MYRRVYGGLVLVTGVMMALQMTAPALAVITHRYSFTANGNDSEGTLNWTANGGATFSGGQVVFDGVDDFLSLATNPLPTSGSFSMEVWGTYDPETAVGSRIFDVANASGGSFLYMTPRATPGTPQGNVDAAAPGPNTRVRWNDNPSFGDIGPMGPASATGQEVLITLVYDPTVPTPPLGNGEFRLYLDGALVATASGQSLPILQSLSSGGTATTIHRLGHGASMPPAFPPAGTDPLSDLPAFLTGSLNEFRIYNSVITPLEVLTNLISGPDVTSVSFNDKTWNAGASNWNTGTNWTTAGVPAVGDRAIISNAGTATVSGAVPQVGALRITNGTLTVGAGGLLDVKYPIELNTGSTSSNAATINVNSGGVLAVGGIVPSGTAGTRTINIDGGTIRPGFKTALVTAGATTVIGAGGATFDTQGTDAITWGSSLSGSGNLTKTGTGTLVLRPQVLALGLVDQNPNYSGEVFVNQGALDVQREHGVLGTAGSTRGGKVHLNNSTLVVNTAYPTGFRKEVIMDIDVTGHSIVSNMVDRAGTEIRYMGSLTGDGTLEFIKPVLTAALGLDFENRANPNVDTEPDMPILPADHSGFTGRLIANGSWAIRFRGSLVDPDLTPMSGDETLYDSMDLPNAILEMVDPDGLDARIAKRGPDPNQIIRIGGLDGGTAMLNAGTGFMAFTRVQASIAGGADNPALAPVTYHFGGANQDATFAGTIQNGDDGDALWDVNTVSVTKVGSNKQTFTGPLTYSGPTTVNGGSLIINGRHSRDARELAGGAPAPAVALPVSDYTVNSGGTLGGSGFIGSAADPVDITLNSGGTLAPGESIGTLTTVGAVNFGASSHFAVEISGTSVDLLATSTLNIASGAILDILPVGGVTAGQYTIAQFGTRTGMFTLNAPSGFSVSYATAGQIVLTAPNVGGGVPGDYNGNGVVDAADYVLWRNGGPLQNDPTSGVQPEDYTFWRSRFGSTTGSGSDSVLGSQAAVPEPASLAMLLLGLALARVGSRRR